LKDLDCKSIFVLTFKKFPLLLSKFISPVINELQKVHHLGYGIDHHPDLIHIYCFSALSADEEESFSGVDSGKALQAG
jgi:hypothetical protein